jgi:hypothetical protein
MRRRGARTGRMADVDLTPMDPRLLPPIAHAAAEGVLPPYPYTFEAVTNLENLVRPDHAVVFPRHCLVK